ncbi:MAG: catalase [Chitinophagales bacterium]
MISNPLWQEQYLNEQGRTENGSPEKEELFFDEIAKQIREVVRHYKEENNNIAQRANHAQVLTGFINAKFKISDQLAEDLKVGFLIPGKEYNAIIRFSNASGELTNDDSKPDLRGVALRIETGNTHHDFLMTNAELHHAKDAREAMITIRAGVEKDIIAGKIPDTFPLEDQIAGLVGALPFLIKHLGFKTGLHIAKTLKQQMNLKVESLSTETFWSRSPIAIGNIRSGNPVAVKFRLRPAIKKREQEEIKEGESNLAKKLEEELNSNDIRYYFEIQRFIDPEITPIEDATRSWGDDSSFETIAELIIPQKSKNEKELADGLLFNPWNVDELFFKPLGSMNRSRRKIYTASADERSKQQSRN